MRLLRLGQVVNLTHLIHGHFHGDALDISLAGMSDSEKIRLLREAQNAGFTGFGLGNNIITR